MGYGYKSWEDSIIFELQPSNKSSTFTGRIYHKFMDRLYPFTPFLGASSCPPFDKITIRHLTKEYSSFILKSLSILLKLLTESIDMSKTFSVILLSIYRLCIDCLDVIASELGEPRASLDHRYYYICCLRHWERYDEAKSECVVVLENFNVSMYETFGYEQEDDKEDNYFDTVLDNDEDREFLEDSRKKEYVTESYLVGRRVDVKDQNSKEKMVLKQVREVEEENELLKDEPRVDSNLKWQEDGDNNIVDGIKLKSSIKSKYLSHFFWSLNFLSLKGGGKINFHSLDLKQKMGQQLLPNSGSFRPGKNDGGKIIRIWMIEGRYRPYDKGRGKHLFPGHCRSRHERLSLKFVASELVQIEKCVASLYEVVSLLLYGPPIRFKTPFVYVTASTPFFSCFAISKLYIRKI